MLAAAYGYGIASSHPFRDGNKRIAFLAMVIFLGVNQKALEAPEAEVVSTMLAVADGRWSQNDLAAWVRRYLVKCVLAPRGVDRPAVFPVLRRLQRRDALPKPRRWR